MKKYFILFSLIIFTPFYSFAKEIALTEELTIEIPNDFQQTQIGSYDYFGNNKDVYIRIVSEDFNHSIKGIKEIFASMDARRYNLNSYTFVKKAKEPIYELQKNYVKHFYTKDGNKVLTYTFYTQKKAYSILFSYKSDNDLAQIEQIISSIKYMPGLWGQLTSIVSYSKMALLLLAAIYGFFCLACGTLFIKGRGLGVGCAVIILCYSTLLAFLIWNFNDWWIAAIIYSITVHFAANSLAKTGNKNNDANALDYIETFDDQAHL